MRHDRRCFGRLEQEDQRLKKHDGRWMDIIRSLQLESFIFTKLTKPLVHQLSCPLPRPCRRPTPWCSRRGRGLYVERLTAGSTAATRKFLLITGKIIIPPPDSRDPLEGPLYFVKKSAPRCTQGSASLLRTKK